MRQSYCVISTIVAGLQQSFLAGALASFPSTVYASLPSQDVHYNHLNQSSTLFSPSYPSVRRVLRHKVSMGVVLELCLSGEYLISS